MQRHGARARHVDKFMTVGMCATHSSSRDAVRSLDRLRRRNSRDAGDTLRSSRLCTCIEHRRGISVERVACGKVIVSARRQLLSPVIYLICASRRRTAFGSCCGARLGCVGVGLITGAAQFGIYERINGLRAITTDSRFTRQMCVCVCGRAAIKSYLVATK